MLRMKVAQKPQKTANVAVLRIGRGIVANRVTTCPLSRPFSIAVSRQAVVASSAKQANCDPADLPLVRHHVRPSRRWR